MKGWMFTIKAQRLDDRVPDEALHAKAVRSIEAERMITDVEIETSYRDVALRHQLAGAAREAMNAVLAAIEVEKIK